MKVTPASDDSMSVDAEVKNASKVDGDEVVQVYLSFPKAPGTPRHALRGFTRVHIAAGETRPVHFTLSSRDLSGVTEAGDRIVAAGGYQLSVGGGQPGTSSPSAKAEFKISKEQKLPE